MRQTIAVRDSETVLVLDDECPWLLPGQVALVIERPGQRDYEAYAITRAEAEEVMVGQFSEPDVPERRAT